jgi:hypothetical protein
MWLSILAIPFDQTDDTVIAENLIPVEWLEELWYKK